MAQLPTIPMSPLDLPSQRIYLVPNYPLEPYGWAVSFDTGASHLPKRRPHSARYLGQVEWSWSPMHSRIDAYHLSLNSARSAWVLWLSFFDDQSWKFVDTHIAAWAPRKGMQGADAAVLLIEAFWRREKNDITELDHFHWVGQEGLLTAAVFKEIGRKVWDDSDADEES